MSDSSQPGPALLNWWDRYIKDHFSRLSSRREYLRRHQRSLDILGHFAKLDPIWAISSMVASIDPNVNLAYQTFRGRLINAMLGCTVGLVFLTLGGVSDWKLPIALSVTVLISSYIVRVPQMWRQAPITAALVVAASLTHHSTKSGAEIGLSRVGEVILGCIVGLSVTYIMSKVWPPPEGVEKAAKS